jgi:hypothetical protein
MGNQKKTEAATDHLVPLIELHAKHHETSSGQLETRMITAVDDLTHIPGARFQALWPHKRDVRRQSVATSAYSGLHRDAFYTSIMQRKSWTSSRQMQG